MMSPLFEAPGACAAAIEPTSSSAATVSTVRRVITPSIFHLGIPLISRASSLSGGWLPPKASQEVRR